MSQTSLISSVEHTIKETLKRLSRLEGNDKKELYNEFKEWINPHECSNKDHDILFINKNNE